MMVNDRKLDEIKHLHPNKYTCDQLHGDVLSREMANRVGMELDC